MTYNMSFTEAPSIVGIFSGVNDASGGLMASLILLGICVIVLIAVSADFKTKLITSGFIGSVVGGALFFIGWISPAIALLPVFILIIGVFTKLWMD